MKKLLTVLSLCFMLLAASAPEMQAQKAKIINSLIKNVGKVKPKPVKPVIKPKPRPTPKPKPRPYSGMVTCSQCGGSGSIKYWDSSKGSYNSFKCHKCDGKGKVRR